MEQLADISEFESLQPDSEAVTDGRPDIQELYDRFSALDHSRMLIGDNFKTIDWLCRRTGEVGGSCPHPLVLRRIKTRIDRLAEDVATMQQQANDLVEATNGWEKWCDEQTG